MLRKWMALALALLMLFSCGAALAEPLTATDGLGRAVTFETAPQTCVSLTPANTEIVCALGLADALLGVDASSNYPEGVQDKQVVGDYAGPNVELIVQLAPDVVFAGVGLQNDVIAKLESLGVKVVCNEPAAYEDIRGGIELLAQVMGAQAEAETLIAQMNQEEAAALEGVQAGEPVKVYCALSFGEYGNYTAGPGTFVDEMIARAGGENVAAKTGIAWPEYSLEQLIMDDPDVILLMDYAFDGTLVDQFCGMDGYKELRCVQEGRVYAVNGDIASRPGPRITQALGEFARCIQG